MSYNFQNILDFISVKNHSSIGIEFALDCSGLDRKDYKNSEYADEWFRLYNDTIEVNL